MKAVVFKEGTELFEVEVLDTFTSKARGLMFSSRARPFLFKFTREATLENTIHSLFCPAFDAVFLDAEKRVTQVVYDLGRVRKRIVKPREPALFLLELPCGLARKHGLRRGDRLEFREE